MTLPLQQPQKVRVERLRLDRENPRLAGRVGFHSDEALVAELYRGAELDELLQSMSSNGYLDIEPLVVMEESEGNLIVLEGNRRLATIRLLTEPEFFSRVRRELGLALTVPKVSSHLLSTFERISVYRVADRNEARPLLGFKHINGPHKWNAYAKARFAAQWYREENMALEDIARAIGDRHDTIARMVAAIYVLDQAGTKDLFDVEDRFPRKFNFSHLYTALSRSEYIEYLGLPRGWFRQDLSDNPVPPEKISELRQVLRWIYGCKSDLERPVVNRQNPDIKHLGAVLVNPEALHVLRDTANLEQAHQVAEDVTVRFTKALFGARRAIVAALGSMRAYDGRDESLLDVSADIRETAETLHSRMTKKHLKHGAK
jgi:hypothetical protein